MGCRDLLFDRLGLYSLLRHWHKGRGAEVWKLRCAVSSVASLRKDRGHDAHLNNVLVVILEVFTVMLGVC